MFKSIRTTLVAVISVISFSATAGLSPNDITANYTSLSGTSTSVHNWEKAVENGYVFNVSRSSKNQFKDYFKDLYAYATNKRYADKILNDRNFYSGIKNSAGEACGQFYRNYHDMDSKTYMADAPKSSVWGSQGTPFIDTGDLDIIWPRNAKAGGYEYNFATKKNARGIQSAIHSRIDGFDGKKDRMYLTLHTNFYKLDANNDAADILPNDSSLYSVYLLPNHSTIVKQKSERAAFKVCYNNVKAVLPPANGNW